MSDMIIFINFSMLIFLMCLMLIIYFKGSVELYPLIVILLLASLILGVASMSITPTMPFTPMFQVIFLLFQVIIFVLASVDTFMK